MPAPCLFSSLRSKPTSSARLAQTEALVARQPRPGSGPAGQIIKQLTRPAACAFCPLRRCAWARTPRRRCRPRSALSRPGELGAEAQGARRALAFVAWHAPLQLCMLWPASGCTSSASAPAELQRSEISGCAAAGPRAGATARTRGWPSTGCAAPPQQSLHLLPGPVCTWPGCKALHGEPASSSRWGPPRP